MPSGNIESIPKLMNVSVAQIMYRDTTFNVSSQVSNNAIRDCENYCEPEGKDFVDPSTDETVKAGSKPAQEQ